MVMMVQLVLIYSMGLVSPQFSVEYSQISWVSGACVDDCVNTNLGDVTGCFVDDCVNTVNTGVD